MELSELERLRSDMMALIDQLPHHAHGRLIKQVLSTIVRMSSEHIERLDWKILASSILDMEGAFQTFYAHQHTRKVTIFGSARTPADKPDYQMAVELAQQLAQQGFMVMTGAGGGIMEAGNRGAGVDKSIGLNIRLPFEQESNPYVSPDRLVSFKYFFTRKLFLLKESDAIVAFPGGFGTQDEVFECLTLIQTGKAEPLPIVFMNHPGNDYWDAWSTYVSEHLLKRRLINREDTHLYRITNSTEVACATIAQFYRVYHSCRYIYDRLLLRLNTELPKSVIADLNVTFRDILVDG
ncbi:MAG: TIGR00730 family Rossman fold protein, partial [Cyanobacteria bacterium]|nr:TIGR00730 family Rossman fold protein [Cyanobacteriota bacterium]MDW8203324.1 TIGR00730 family Rossman fold protein [Cyanobacteriota bacterium SKYGB_h_bin112]